jgi:uncharacterized protein (TIGR03067 family)
MRSCSFFCATIGLAIAVEAGARCVDLGNDTTAGRIARLIEQLGNDSFARREAASKDLEAIGEPALGSLRKAASGGDAEIRLRAKRIVRAIAARAGQKELAKWAGSWKSPDGTWMKITGDRWSSGTPTFGPVAGVMRVTELREKMVLADFSVEEGPTKGKIAKAIFRLDGDSLHYCATYDDQYPTKFETAGTCYSCVFVRVKK